jgi:serine/threonine protein kinase
MALAESTAEKAPIAVDTQVSCQYCKYLLEGVLLGDCRVTRWIGSGAFGDVYEAEQLPPLHRRVAIKVMSIDQVLDGKAIELFAREVGAIAKLDHPNILPVMRVGMLEDGRSYLVMKYAAHGSLQNYCRVAPQGFSLLPTAIPAEAMDAPMASHHVDSEDTVAGDHQDRPYEHVDERAADQGDEVQDADTQVEGEQVEDNQTIEPVESELEKQNDAEASMLTPRQLLSYVEDAASALQYAHDHGIIHLDVKPANLLLDGNDRLMLADFGVSALLDGYTHASLHAYVGTPLYTAPEQWLEQPRAASDQYALAVTCYQLLTGHAPFTGNLYSIMHGHLQTPPPPLREFNPLIPTQLEDVILRALAKEPGDRYKDMLAFAHAYRDALEAAASAQTDTNGQVHATETIENAAAPKTVEQSKAHLNPEETVMRATLVVAPTDEATNEGGQSDKLAVRQLGRSAAILDEIAPARSEWEAPGAKLRPMPVQRSEAKRVSIFRSAGLLLLVLLLAGSGTLGLIRMIQPCLLGVCPNMQLSTHEVNLVNDGSQLVRISDTGSSDLHWQALVLNSKSIPWLTLSSPQGALAPGKTTAFTIKANTTNLSDGERSAIVEISGQNVASQDIYVNVSVQKGLDAVSVENSGTQFLHDQGKLQPTTQKITVTNKSIEPLIFQVEYTETTWLTVTPSQGVLAPGKSISLVVNVVNPQSLTPNNDYQTSVSLLGKLQSQKASIELQRYDFTLDVPAASATPTPSLTATATPQFIFPNFDAQAPISSGAPTTLRSGHSMVWDDHDNLLLVFGGIDNAGHLLNDLWSYSPETGQWKQLSAAGAAGSCNSGTIPSARMNAAMVWDNVDQQVLLYGGLGSNNHYLSDLWSYALATGTWTEIACSNNGPGARSSGAVWNGSQMLLLGGTNKYGLLSDFWSYTPGSDGGWQELAASTPLGKRTYSTMVWDNSDNRLYVFGGLDVNGLQNNDFYVYSANSGWSSITPKTASNPLPRQQAMGAWDSKDHALLLMGGWQDGQDEPFWGLWAYDPRQDAWKLLTPLDSNGAHILPGRTASIMVWDAVDRQAYIYAGAGNGKSGSSLNDLWIITNG